MNCCNETDERWSHHASVPHVNTRDFRRLIGRHTGPLEQFGQEMAWASLIHSKERRASKAEGGR